MPSALSILFLPLAVLTAVTESSNSDFKCDPTGAGPQYNATSKYLGCYDDPSVSILGSSKLSSIAMTPQFCANYCGNLGFAFGGIEFTTQCFCGSKPDYDNAKKVNDSTCSSKCVTEPSSSCGATYVMSLYQITNPANVSGSGPQAFVPVCQTSPFCSHKACDTSLSIPQRVAALVSSLTQEEKILNLVDAAAGSTRLGLPSYEWWSEALHGVASSPGVQFPPPPADFSYATSFGSPILTAAAFDDNLVYEMAKVIGKEARAFGNYGFSGFDFWTPNINPFRDPRWGRGQETPGEDAYHVQNYIRNLIPGLQGDDAQQKQIIATCKHYAAYDLETGRYGNDYNPSQQDKTDYFLAPFKTCVRDAKVGSVMCSYNAVDGIPTCASQYLLEDVMRQHWGFTQDYNYIVSDCGAVTDIWQYHNFTNTEEAAAAVAINAGTDLECGQSYIKLNQSLAQNHTSIDTLDRSLTRLYSALFSIGYFDGSKYQSLSFSDVGTAAAQSLAYNAAVAGMTLLKNDGLLPLDDPSKYKTAALIGPFANATSQLQGNYFGTAKQVNGPLSAFKKIWNVQYSLGAAINGQNTSGFAAAIAAAKKSDIVFYLGGIDNSIESETLDRTSLAWPGNQLELIEELSKLGKSLVVVQFGGGQVDDSALLGNKRVRSLVWAGYPGQDGGPALVDVLTGKQSIAGRLPVTQYPTSYAQDVSIYNINLRPNGSFPGRTYKWYTGEPVLPFGHGLHYTEFSYRWGSKLQPSYEISDIINKAGSSKKDTTPFATVTAFVKNAGKRTSDYVGLAFIQSSNAGPTPRPKKSLVSYARLHNLKAGSEQKLSLPLTLGSLARADSAGNLVIWPGDYKFSLDFDQQSTFEFSLKGKSAKIETLPPLAAKYNFTVPVHLEPPSTEPHSPLGS